MGKKSKRNRERKVLRQEWALQNQFGKQEITSILDANKLFPSSVATNSSIDDLLDRHRDESNFRIIFASYNHNECELYKMHEPKKARALITLFDKITKCSPKSLPSTGLIRDNVHNDGEYKPLFYTVPPDVELKEADFGGKGRIYFYIYQNFFCIVTIQTIHKNN